MSILDAPLRAVAKNLTRKFGTRGTVDYVTTGGYNPVTGLASAGAPEPVPVYGSVERYAASEIDGTTVRRGDVKWTVPAKDIDRPRVNDLATLDGDVNADGEANRYTIVSVQSIYSGEEHALHVLQLRR